MNSSGVFFLRGKPWSVRFTSADGKAAPGWIFPLGERTSSRGVLAFSAIWKGDEADRFVAEHPDLRAGQCLLVELNRLHAADNELRGHVVSCALAPARWPAADGEPAPEPDAGTHSLPNPNPNPRASASTQEHP